MKVNEDQESNQFHQIKHSKSNSFNLNHSISSSPKQLHHHHHHHLLHNRIKHDSFSIPSSSTSTSTSTSTSSTSHHHHHQSINHKSSSLSSSDHFNLNSTIQLNNVIQQNIIRSRFQYHHTHQSHNQAGLEVVMYLKLSIPYSSLSKVNGRSVIIPLMSDHHLRLKKSIIFPLTRKSTHAKPTLQAIPNRSEAERTASILNLSKSFRITPDHQRQPPSATVSVRNFSISLLISLPNLHHPIESHSNLWDDEHAVAEYALVLESIVLWTTVGPDWPYSVIIPTPTCLRNSFRLMLPSEDESDSNESSNKINVITSPTLRRERLTMSSTKFNEISTSKSCPIILGEESKSLTDESEPDYSGLSEDDEISLRPTHWTQDESSNRYEGVFQSTNELCVSINHQPIPHGSLPIENSITAQRAETNLAISIHRGKNHHLSNSNSLSLTLNLQVTLYNLALKFDQPMIPFVFHLPDHIASQIISSEWSGITGDSVIESLVPFHDAQADPSQAIPPTQETTPRNKSIKPIPSLSKETSLPDLELLHTSAPFEESGADLPGNSPWGAEDGEVEASFETSFSTPIKPRHSLEPHSSPQIDQIPGDVRGRFVVWFDLSSLIRYIDTTSSSQEKVCLKFNLHGQIEVRLKKETNEGAKGMDLPLFGFPTVDQHTCFMNLSVDPSLSPTGSELDLRLPISATRLDLEKESEDDRHGCLIRVNVRKVGPEMGVEETIKVYYSKPVLKKEAVTLRSPINGLDLDQEPRIAVKPRLKKRFSASRYRHSHTISSGSLPITYRKRTPTTDQLNQMKFQDIKVSDQVDEDEDDSEMKLTIASAELDISFSTTSCQYLDLGLRVLKEGGNGREDQGIIGMQFVIGWNDRFELIEAWIGTKRLKVGNGIRVLEQRSELEKVIDLQVCLVEFFSKLMVCWHDELMIRMVLKILRCGKDCELEWEKRVPICLPRFSRDVSLLDVKVANFKGTQLSVLEGSFDMVSGFADPVIRLRRYAVGADERNLIRFEEVKEVKKIEEVKEVKEEKVEKVKEEEGIKIERLSWIEEKLESYEMNWKTVMMVWSLYLILSLRFEVYEMSVKFERFEERYGMGMDRVGDLQGRGHESCLVKSEEWVGAKEMCGLQRMGMGMEREKEREKRCGLVPGDDRIEGYEAVEPSIPIKSSSSSSSSSSSKSSSKSSSSKSSSSKSPIRDNLDEEIEKKKNRKEKVEGKSSIGEPFGYIEKLWISLWVGIKSIFG